MTEQAVEVEGLWQVRRALRNIDKKLPREIRLVANEAAQAIVTEGKRIAATRGTRQQNAAARSLRVRSTQSSVRVALGTKKIAFAFGAEYGAKRYPQFPPVNKKGYFMWPAIRAKRKEVLKEFDESLGKLAKREGISYD